MYAAFAWIQVSCGLGGGILFTTIYNLTLDIFHGLVFIISAGLFAIAIIFARYFWILRYITSAIASFIDTNYDFIMDSL